MIQNYAVHLKESVVSDRARRQDSNSTIRALIYLMEDVLVDCLRDFICDKAFPLEKPVRADHEPVVLGFRVFFGWLFTALLSVEFEVENDLFFNFSTQF